MLNISPWPSSLKVPRPSLHLDHLDSLNCEHVFFLYRHYDYKKCPTSFLKMWQSFTLDFLCVTTWFSTSLAGKFLSNHLFPQLFRIHLSCATPLAPTQFTLIHIMIECPNLLFSMSFLVRHRWRMMMLASRCIRKDWDLLGKSLKPVWLLRFDVFDNWSSSFSYNPTSFINKFNLYR